MATAKEMPFDTEEVIRACEAAQAAGRPLSDVFEIGKKIRRGGPNTQTQYSTLYARVPTADGKGRIRAPLVVRAVKEKHVGRINPLEESEVHRINAELNGKAVVKQRDKKPTLNVQKYKVWIDVDETGQPSGPLPEDERSVLFRLVEYVDAFFYETIQEMLDSKRIVQKQDNSRAPRQAAAHPPDAIVVARTNIVPLFQTAISASAAKDANLPLANPIFRMSMKFTKEGEASYPFYDFTKRRQTAPNKVEFDLLRFDGQPVSASNVHKIAPHSIFSGLVHLDTVCFSNMGISIPTEIYPVILEPPPKRVIGVEDVFGSSMMEALIDGADSGHAAASGAAIPAQEEPSDHNGESGGDDGGAEGGAHAAMLDFDELQLADE